MAFVGHLLGLLPGRFALAAVLSVAVAITEGIGLLLLVPLLQVVGLEVQQGGLGRIEAVVRGAFAVVGVRPTLAAVLLVFVASVAARAALGRWQTTASLRLEQDLVRRLRDRLYRAIAGTRWAFFSRQRGTAFTHALTMEVERAGGAASDLLAILVQMLVAAAYVLIALQLSASLTAVALACGAVLLLLTRRETDRARALGERLSETGSALFAAAGEHVAGMKVARAAGAEDRHARQFAAASGRVARAYVEAGRSYAAARFRFEVGSVALLAVLLYAALERLALPAAGALLLLFIFARLAPRLSALQQARQRLVHALPAFAAVMALVDACEREAEPDAAPSLPMALRAAVRFEGVTFAYGPDARPAVAGLDLIIPARRATAIVGPSGAGKSTVADLLMGLLTPDRGRILVDEVPLGPERLAAWRAQIGYVPQDAFLFHDTVRANLLWARPEAGEADLLEALRLADAGEIVAALPRGLDTMLGDRGATLSGGERQRVALARALLRRPSLLILDEATSGVDLEQERRILDAVRRLPGPPTLVIIGHRPSFIRHADLVHVLHEGRLVRSGTSQELAGVLTPLGASPAGI